MTPIRSASDLGCYRRVTFSFFIAIRFAALVCIYQSPNAYAAATVLRAANEYQSLLTNTTVPVPIVYADRCVQIRQKLVAGMTKVAPSTLSYIPLLTVVSVMLCPTGLPALPLSIAVFCLRFQLHSTEPYPQLRNWSVTTTNIFLVDRVCSFLVVQPLVNPHAIHAFIAIAHFSAYDDPLSWLPIAISTIITSIQVLVLMTPVLRYSYRIIVRHLYYPTVPPKPLGFPSAAVFANPTSPLQSVAYSSHMSNSTQPEYPAVWHLPIEGCALEDSPRTSPSSVRSIFMPSRTHRPTFLSTHPPTRPLSGVFDEDASNAKPIA